jgi:hypothetical protein
MDQQQQQQVVISVNNDSNDDGNNVPVNQVQVVQGADGSKSLKVEQTMLPKFWGQKEKGSIASKQFVKRIKKMATANNWSDKIAFQNFALTLWGLANTWLDSQVTLEDITTDRERWTIIWPFFKAEFPTESDDKLILDGLAHLAMKHTKNVQDYFG